VEMGIPIGICLSVPPFSIKIGYNTVPQTIANVDTNAYKFFVDVYLSGSCSILTTTTDLDEVVPIPEACINYQDYVDEYYPNSTGIGNNTFGYNVDMTISATFSNVVDPWGALPMGEFTFLFVSASQCLSASASTNPTTGSGAFYNWLVADVCVDGAIATCGGTNSGNSLTVAAYSEPTCAAGSEVSSETFSQVICGSYDASGGSGSSSQIQEILELFGIDMPAMPIITDDSIISSYIGDLAGTTYCGNESALTAPTLQPTGSAGSASSAGAMTKSEVVETVVGSVFGAALLLFVLFVCVFRRAAAQAYLFGASVPSEKEGYSQYNDEGAINKGGFMSSSSSPSAQVGAHAVGPWSAPMAQQNEL
jgi:hypothetical protein